jgi:beta-xylosidase
MRYRLRTLLILLAVAPPLLAVGYWVWADYKVRQARAQLEYIRGVMQIEPPGGGVTSILTEPNP